MTVRTNAEKHPNKRRTTNDPMAKVKTVYGYNIYRKGYARTFVQRLSDSHGSIAHVFDLYEKEVPFDILERAIAYAENRGRSITFSKENRMELSILSVRKQHDLQAEFEAIAEYDLAIEPIYHPSYAPRFVVLEGIERQNRFYSCFCAKDTHDVRTSAEGELWYKILGFVDDTYQAQLILNISNDKIGVPMF